MARPGQVHLWCDSSHGHAAMNRVNQHYTCDSEFVWQIHPTDVARFKPQSIGMRVFVCIHQVELD